MDRLAKNGVPQGDYDVVVIGSGYGGAIAACRLARTGKRVCLLERGAEIQPGEYPDTMFEAGKQVQITLGSGHHGPRLGMFDFRAHEGMSALVGCGLGGTSLINANVSLWPDQRVFEQDEWPGELHEAQELAPFRARAEDMLRPTPYPVHPGEQLPLPKTAALQSSAAALDVTQRGATFGLTPINVNFAPDHHNHADTFQRPCNNCGDCVTGCNVRAKNTTLMNYLPDARNNGAEIFVQRAVSHVDRDGSRWRVYFTWLGSGQADFRAPEFVVTADVVVLAAGTLGSTEIMLRSKERGLPTSDRIGERFSGNGDVLAFGYATDRVIDGVGYGERIPDPHRPVGPCITGVVDRPSTNDVRDSWLIEEGAIPGAIDTLTALALAVADQVGPDTPGAHPERVSPAPWQDTTLHTRAIDRSQTYLVMSHDDSAGALVLAEDRLRIEWDDPGGPTELRIDPARSGDDGCQRSEREVHSRPDLGAEVRIPAHHRASARRLRDGCGCRARRRQPRGPGLQVHQRIEGLRGALHRRRVDRPDLAGHESVAHHLGAGRAHRRASCPRTQLARRPDARLEAAAGLGCTQAGSDLCRADGRVLVPVARTEL